MSHLWCGRDPIPLFTLKTSGSARKLVRTVTVGGIVAVDITVLVKLAGGATKLLLRSDASLFLAQRLDLDRAIVMRAFPVFGVP